MVVKQIQITAEAMESKRTQQPSLNDQNKPKLSMYKQITEV
jgi:hypothetical protein